MLKIAYLILLVTSFFYVRSVLDADSFKAVEKQSVKPAEKVVGIDVKLSVYENNKTAVYESKMKSSDSVQDLLAELRKSRGLLYEVDIYTYGSEIVSVFDKEPDAGKKWAVLLGDNNLTSRMSDEYLVDDAEYILKQQ